MSFSFVGFYYYQIMWPDRDFVSSLFIGSQYLLDGDQSNRSAVFVNGATTSECENWDVPYQTLNLYFHYINLIV